jgi:hypothetical protein
MTPRIEAMKAMIDATTAAYTVAPDFVGETLATLMEEWRAGSPMPPLLEMADEAEFWAANATPLDMEAVLVAIARHLPETHLHTRARKRLVAALFKGMGQDDRAAFLAWGTTQ